MTTQDHSDAQKIAKIRRYEDKIDWTNLSRNTNITIDVVKAFLNKPWSYKLLSMNSGIQIEEIADNLHLPFSMGYASFNPNVTMAHIQHPPPKVKVTDKETGYDKYYIIANKYTLLENPNFSMEYKIANFGLPFLVNNSSVLQHQPDLSIAHIRALNDYIKEHNLSDTDLDWFGLSANSAIAIDNVVANLDLPWSAEGLSSNQNTTIYVMQKYCDTVNWSFIHACNHLPMEIIEANIESLIDERGYFEDISYTIFENPACTTTFMLKHVDKFECLTDIASAISTVTIIEEDIPELEKLLAEELSLLWSCLSYNPTFLDM